MGWATYLTTSIEFNRKTYNNKYDVESDLEDARDNIRRAKEDLTRLAFMTEPQKYCDSTERPDYYIKEELSAALETLEEALIEEYKLNLLLYSWDKCHLENGLAKESPLNWDDAYLDGDFVYTDKHPTQENIFGYELNHKGEVVNDSNAIVDENGKFKPTEPVNIDDIVEQSLKEVEDEQS